MKGGKGSRTTPSLVVWFFVHHAFSVCLQDDTQLQLRLCTLRREDAVALFRDTSSRAALVESFSSVLECKWNPNEPDCLGMLNSKGEPGLGGRLGTFFKKERKRGTLVPPTHNLMPPPLTHEAGHCFINSVSITRTVQPCCMCQGDVRCPLPPPKCQYPPLFPPKVPTNHHSPPPQVLCGGKPCEMRAPLRHLHFCFQVSSATGTRWRTHFATTRCTSRATGFGRGWPGTKRRGTSCTWPRWGPRAHARACLMLTLGRSIHESVTIHGMDKQREGVFQCCCCAAPSWVWTETSKPPDPPSLPPPPRPLPLLQGVPDRVHSPDYQLVPIHCDGCPVRVPVQHPF
jgi:hypothetical protein